MCPVCIVMEHISSSLMLHTLQCLNVVLVCICGDPKRMMHISELMFALLLLIFNDKVTVSCGSHIITLFKTFVLQQIIYIQLTG